MSIPRNLEECFGALKKILPADEIEKFKNKEERAASVDAHFGLGLWIRNNWIYPESSPLREYMLKLGLRHPDDMSAVILGTFWCHLHEKPLRLEERVAYYREYWESKKR